MPDSALFFFVIHDSSLICHSRIFLVILDLIENLYPRLARTTKCTIWSYAMIGELTEPLSSITSFVSVLWTFASLKSQMLGSVISMQAWLRLSPYAFVV